MRRAARILARLSPLVAAGLLALGLTTGTLAYFTAAGNGSSSAVAATLAAPAVTATSSAPGVVDVGWTAVPAPGSPADDDEVEFTVERSPAGGSSWIFVCGTGVTPLPYDTLSCTDSSVPGGDYDYRVTARFRTWTSSGEGSVTVVGGAPPEVLSINRAGASPTNTGPLTWTVTFSEPVNGVVTSSFGLVTAGIGGTAPAITSATPVGAAPAAQWTVSVSTTGTTGTNAGSIRLDLTSPAGIQDVDGTPLSGTFTGQAYTYDTTAPSVSSVVRAGTSPTNAGPLTWTVTFSEPVTGVTTSHFGLVTSGIGGAAPAITSATPIGAAPAAQWTVSVSTTGTTGTNAGSIRLDLTSSTAIADAASNPLSATLPVVGEAYTFDTTAPTLVSLAMLDTNQNGKVDEVVATFSESLDSGATGTPAWTLLAVPSGGTLSSVSASGPAATLTITEGPGAPDTAVGSFTIALAASPTGIRDAAGNEASFTATAPSDEAAPVAVDVQAVNGSGTAGRIDSGDVITYTFSERIAPGTILSGWTGSSITRTVTLTNSGSNDTVTVSGTSLGTLATGGDYVKSTRTVNATMAQSGAVITVTFTSAAPPGQLNTVVSSTLVWTPSSGPTDLVGNALVTTACTQSGAPKQNF